MTAFYEWLADASLWWWPQFADHLWQTTLFVLVVVVAASALRRNPARLRYNFWLLASAKFIVPAVLFVFLAQQVGIDSLPFFRSVPQTEQNLLLVNGVTEPVSAISSNYDVAVIANPTQDRSSGSQGGQPARGGAEIYLALTAVWLAGCAAFVTVWAVRRQKFVRSLRLGGRLQTGREWQALTRAKKALHLNTDVGLLISPLKIEPAAWRVWKPVVVMPASISSQLDDQELEAIMLHELVHIQRRDNLIGNLQLALCALLWFHPLVWFISRKLFDEREQACDERVIEVCGAPDAYAASILKVVRFCFGWKVAGVSGAASGSNLRRRIENIMSTGNTKSGTGTGSGVLAGALVVTALVVLVGAGIYSKAQGRDTNAIDLEAAAIGKAPVSDGEVVLNSAAKAPNALAQQTRTAPPTPPSPPPAPEQASEPAQPSQPPPAPEPPQVPEPTQAPNPAQAPQPSQAPNPASVPKPAQAPQPPTTPEPWQRPKGASSFGVGNEAGKGIGAPRAATSIGAGVGSMAVSPMPATVVGRSAAAPAAISIGRGVGSRAATSVGGSATAPAAIGIGRGVGERRDAASPGAPTVAPASPAAAPAPRALPARQERSKPQDKKKVERAR